MMMLKGANVVNRETVTEDLAQLSPAWWMNFGLTPDCAAPGFIPMTWDGSVPTFSPSILLVFNEPNAPAPYGCHTTAKDAAQKVRAIEQACPGTRLVVGDVSAEDWGDGLGDGAAWITAFRREYRRLTLKQYVGAIGIHVYGSDNDVNWCKRMLMKMSRAAGKGREVWVTEAGMVRSTPLSAGLLMGYMAKNYPRWSWCPARDVPGAPWSLADWLPLVGQDGQLTATGKEWSKR